MFKIASWNVNSLKIRKEQVIDWLETNTIDVLAMQETKLPDAQFPLDDFISRGYHVVHAGQKTYNGVALISRLPLLDSLCDIPDLEDPQRRILAATVGDVRIINLYVPNGSVVGSDKYVYKLHWLEKVTHYIQDQLTHYAKLVVLGDFNIAPADRDVYDPLAWEGQVLVSPAERDAFQQILALGLHDAFRELYPQEQQFTWWDYRQGAFRRKMGLRIDHILLSQIVWEQCRAFDIDQAARGHERPSDHAPVTVSLEI